MSSYEPGKTAVTVAEFEKQRAPVETAVHRANQGAHVAATLDFVEVTLRDLVPATHPDYTAALAAVAHLRQALTPAGMVERMGAPAVGNALAAHYGITGHQLRNAVQRVINAEAG